MHYRCWAEVDLSALRGNLAWIRHRVGPRVKIITVVKADAYGPDGERYFTTETVARVLGLSVEETEAKALRWLGPAALNPHDDVTLVQ